MSISNTIYHLGVRFAEHLVKADDDLTDLAVRYSSSEAEIRRFNRRVRHYDLLHAMLC
jgi:hypothetical protein